VVLLTKIIATDLTFLTFSVKMCNKFFWNIMLLQSLTTLLRMKNLSIPVKHIQ